jgi:hypothetical protein
LPLVPDELADVSLIPEDVYGLSGYTILNFIVFVASAPKSGGGGSMPPQVVRGFSGHWMFFYAAAACLTYSALMVETREVGRRCTNGHEIKGSDAC